MYKSTANNHQFQRRDGSQSTKGSARGVNLLGWEMPEDLTPEQQRAAIAARVTQINEILQGNVPPWVRRKLGQEQFQLQGLMREIRPTRRCPGIEQHFIDVARERLTVCEFNVWMGEAARRLKGEV